MEIPYIVNPRKDTGLINSKIAIWLFLASEVMLFGGFFSAYVYLRMGADYPWPERTLPVLPGLINTFILIASSVTVVFAWVALKLGNWRQFQIYMAITVALSTNPAVSAQGRIREVAPRADAVTGTFRVRVGLIEPPAELRLGSTVTATSTFDPVGSIEVPASALTSADGKPAVWVVDAATMAVALRPVTVDRFTPAAVVVLEGLGAGDIVVTAGVQALRPGQTVRLMGASS